MVHSLMNNTHANELLTLQKTIKRLVEENEKLKKDVERLIDEAHDAFLDRKFDDHT